MNELAFLGTLAWCEGTDDDNGYRALFGHTKRKPKLFDSFADHPRVRTYEAYDGQFIKNDKIDYTTAAGRYQITESTWEDFIRANGPHDFSPASQDKCALWLIETRAKALDAVREGRLRDAISRCAPIWASLPGGPYPQPTRTYERCEAKFLELGGRLEGTPAPIIEKSPPYKAPEWPFNPEAPMALPAAAIISLGTLLAEKIPEVAALIFDKTKTVPERNVNAAAEVIRTVTQAVGAVNEQQAVEKVLSDPVALKTAQAAVVVDWYRLSTLVKELQEADEASRDRAAARAKVDTVDLAPQLAKESNWTVYAVLLGFVALASWQIYKSADGSLSEGMFSLLGVIIMWAVNMRTKLFEYRFGTSTGSEVKNEILRAERRG